MLNVPDYLIARYGPVTDWRERIPVNGMAEGNRRCTEGNRLTIALEGNHNFMHIFGMRLLILSLYLWRLRQRD